jgi:hypothetical protein
VTDLTITCAEGDIITPSDLDYSNGETGECEISGTVTGVITGSLDECGGTLTQTWTFSDACNTITATQSITVQPAPPPVFDAVTDITITCAEGDIITPSDLDYTNSETGEERKCVG